MISDTDDVAAAFRSANPVPAGAFEDAVRDPQALRTLRQILGTRPEWAARRFWRRAAIFAAPLAAMAGAAAIVVALVAGAGPQASRIVTAAYTVTRSPDGTVSVVFNPGRALTDPVGLHRALAREGVPNRVLVGSPSCPPGSTGNGKPLPAARDVLSAGPDGDSVVVHPRLMPPGSVLVITVVHAPDSGAPGGSIYAIGSQLTDHPPTCVTYTGPTFGGSAG